MDNDFYPKEKIKHLLNHRGYKSGPFGSALILNELDETGDYLVYSPEHITNMNAVSYYLPPSRLKEMSQFFLETDDIFFPIVGTLGKAKIFTSNMPKGILNQRLARIAPNTEKIIPMYLQLCMCEYDEFREQLSLYSKGAILEHITKEALLQIALPLPDLNTQQKILDFLDEKIYDADGLIQNCRTQLALLDRYKRDLIAECVTKGLDKSAPMKDSGEDWIGDVPEHWEILPLFAVAEENKTKNIGMVCENLLSLSYGKIIRKDINSNFGLLPASFEGYQIVQEGYTVLRLTDLQNDQRSLRTGYVHEEGIITSAYLALKPSDKVDGKYFQYLLYGYDLIKLFYALGSGLRQTLNFSDIKRLSVLVPPLIEQKNIAAYLDDKMEKIETLKADIEAQIEKLKDYRRIIIHDAVTGKIKV